MTQFLHPTFTVGSPGTRAYRDGWERTFRKYPENNAPGVLEEVGESGDRQSRHACSSSTTRFIRASTSSDSPPGSVRDHDRASQE